jgi:hypothetical protein
MMNTPLLLIIYNRPDKVKELILSLSKIKPQNIYVFCDGPKNKEDEGNVKQSRELISKINWTKKIKTNYLTKNKGCKNGVNASLDWFFANVKEGIILEDDCIPNLSFFKFTSELLEYYKNNKRISIITGFNAGNKLKNYKYDYYFSIYGGVWGWASWRNRWQEYRKSNLSNLLSNKRLLISLKDKGVSSFFIKNVKDSISGKLNTWDYMWTFYNMTEGRLSVVPQKNFISNIGFGEDATHTKSLSDMAKIKREKLDKKISHPVDVLPSKEIDRQRSLNHNKYYQIIRFIKTKLGIFN